MNWTALISDSGYVVTNLTIGAGIAADAMLATIARARSLNRSADAIRWASAIGLTHWLFPMVGFLGGWYLATSPVVKAVVYGFGGALLLCYVVHILRERVKIGSANEQEAPTSFWLAVWGVSVDALITGPGKAAATAHWTTTQVMFSFPFVGAVVFALVLLATAPAMVLHRRILSGQLSSSRSVAIFFFAATWLELGVFTWFAILSLIEAGGAVSLLTPSYALVAVVTALCCTSMMILTAAAVWRAQASNARNL